jgi:hypothetical protein
MTFTVSSGVIYSDAGFRIVDIDDGRIRYIAPSLSLTMRVVRTEAAMTIEMNDLTTWDEPHSTEPLTLADKFRLQRFIEEAYRAVQRQVSFR